MKQMWIKTNSDELNAMNESIVKHICWHLILLNRNTRFLFESFDPYHSNVFCHSGLQHLDWIIVFYFRGQFIVQISISRQSQSNGFLTSCGINDDSFFKLWTITPSSTDANENDSLLLSEWIVLMFLMHPCTSMAVGATIGVDCLGPAAFPWCEGESKRQYVGGEGGPSALHGSESPPATGLPLAQACLEDWH